MPAEGKERIRELQCLQCLFGERLGLAYIIRLIP